MILTAELTDMVVEKLAEGQNLCFMVVQSYYGVTEKKQNPFAPFFFRFFGQTKSFGHRSKIYFYNRILPLSMSNMFGTVQKGLD